MREKEQNRAKKKTKPKQTKNKRYFEKNTKLEVKCGKREEEEERTVVTCGPKKQRNKDVWQSKTGEEKDGQRHAT